MIDFSFSFFFPHCCNFSDHFSGGCGAVVVFGDILIVTSLAGVVRGSVLGCNSVDVVLVLVLICVSMYACA